MKILVPIAMLGALAIAFFVWLPEHLGDRHPLTSVINSTRVAATNAAMDASGIKAKVHDALKANSNHIANATGLPVLAVNSAIDQLDIQNWQVIDLPAKVEKHGSIDINYSGIDGAVTTYEDPSIVTIEAYGQQITLEVPEASQQYIAYLTLLDKKPPNQ